jgi:uncharacterized protein
VVTERRAGVATGWGNVLVAVALLAVSNLMTNRVLPGWAYVPWSLVVASALLVVALRVDDCTIADIGLGRSALGRGAAYGGVVALAVFVVYLGALALPATRQMFDDARVGDVAFLGLAYQVFVRIPLGTVLLEELAFRGVLLAMLLRRTTLGWAVFGSSLLFGLWHVLPAIGIERTNPVLSDVFGDSTGRAVAVVAAVAATAAAGAVLCWLRLRSGSLLAPTLVHLSTNSLGFLVAWTFLRLR